MIDPRLADHEMGLELQLVELVEQRRRAEVQGRDDEARSLQRTIDTVQLELAATAENIAREDHFGRPRLHTVDRAGAA